MVVRFVLRPVLTLGITLGCAFPSSIASVRPEPQDTVCDKLTEDPGHHVRRQGEESARLRDRQAGAGHFDELALDPADERLAPGMIPPVNGGFRDVQWNVIEATHADTFFMETDRR